MAEKFTNACDSSDSAKLMDDIAWKEVDVIISQMDASIKNPFSMELIQLCILHPLDTLQH